MDQTQPDYNLADPEDEAIDLRALLDILMGSRWLIIGCGLVALAIGIFYAWIATPIYRSNALVQVELRSSNLGAGGGGALDTYFQRQTLGPAEIQIIQSRTVIADAVRRLNLDFRVQPRHFPVIGAAIADDNKSEAQPVRAPLWLRRYAWGGEKIRVTRMRVPASMQGRTFVLVAGEQGEYRIIDAGTRETLLAGTVGKVAKGLLPGVPAATVSDIGNEGDDASLVIEVQTLRANPGTEFLLRRIPVKDAVSSIRSRLEVDEASSGTGILTLELEGEDPQQTADTLDAIANDYLRQNVERRTEEAAKRLEFLNGQLPRVKDELQTAEQALREFRERTGTVNLSQSGQAILQQLTDVETRISELQLQRPEIEEHYTSQHPVYQAFNEKLSALRGAKARINKELGKLPQSEYKALQLQRDVEVPNQLYVSLLNTSQELRIAKAGTVGDVRIIDKALFPERPVRPKPPLIAALALVIGLILGVAATFARHVLVRTLQDPDVLEQRFGIPVYAVIPHSRNEERLRRNQKNGGAGEQTSLLAREHSHDSAVESLRSLRTSLQFALFEAHNNIVAISGPTPGVGKSFVAANLALLLADMEKKVLLIDGDLRRGRLHEYMGTQTQPGLSDVIGGQAQLAECLLNLGESSCTFLPRGTVPPNPSELLGNPRFAQLLASASEKYDLIIIDSPPTLNLADGILISKQAGTNFFVTRGGLSTLHDIEIGLKRVQQNKIAVTGLIFNDLKVSGSSYGYGYGYYGTNYSPKKA